MTETTRALATVRSISEIKAHTNADALELAIIDGWQCVVKKDEFKAGGRIVYFEIDSWIPDEIAPFLSKGKVPREYEGVKGERLKTIKLRGELSQGLVMPLSIVPTEALNEAIRANDGACLGIDVTTALNVKKWEKPISPQLIGLARGNFPSFIRKTDQERIQNLFNKLKPEQIEDYYEVTLKLDGSSTTYYVNNGEVGVCSRNLELKTDESNAENMYVKMFNQLGLREGLLYLNEVHGLNIAIQGELWGAGINGNWEGVSRTHFNVFDIYNINTGKYLSAAERMSIVDALGLNHVPVIEHTSLIKFRSVQHLLEFADRPSIHNKIAEGVVFKSLSHPDFSFKVINNKYLLGGGE